MIMESPPGLLDLTRRPNYIHDYEFNHNLCNSGSHSNTELFQLYEIHEFPPACSKALFQSPSRFYRLIACNASARFSASEISGIANAVPGSK